MSKVKTVKAAGYVQLGRYLKTKREDKGFKKTKLGSLLNVPHTTITYIEKQQRRLDIIEMVCYCKALGVDPLEALQVVIDAESGKKQQQCD